MAILELIHDDLADRRDLVGESEFGARSDEQVAIGVNASAKVKIRTGEVIAIAIAENAKFKCRQKRDLDCAGQVHRCARGSHGGVSSTLSCPRLTTRSDLQSEWDQRCNHALVWSRSDDVPRAFRVCSRSGTGLVRRPGNAFAIVHVGDVRARNCGRVVGRIHQGLQRGGVGRLRTLIKLREFRSQVLDAGFRTIVGKVALKVVAAHPGFVADHEKQPDGYSRQQNRQH